MGSTQANAPALKPITATTTDQRQSGDDGLSVVNLPVQADDRLVLTVVEAAHRLEIRRSVLNELIAPGEIQSIHVGRLRRIPADALTDYINSQGPEWPDPAA